MSKKLMLTGDSLLAQCGKDETVFLEGQLKGGYDVYNCATSGWNSDDLAKKAPYLAVLKPDVLIISIGTNDGSPWKQVELERFRSNLQLIAEAFKDSRVIFFPPPPVNEARRSESKMIRNEGMQAYNQAVVNFCKGRDLEYWDSWRFIEPLVGTDSDPHNEDGVHFSDPGYELILAEMAKVVQS